MIKHHCVDHKSVEGTRPVPVRCVVMDAGPVLHDPAVVACFTGSEVEKEQ
jgi:hypothetical protein